MPSTATRLSDGSSSITGRNRARTLAARIDTSRMSSASVVRASIRTRSAPKPFTTRTPATDSSTTVDSWACSDCTARTAGWIAFENRRAVRLMKGRAPNVTSASNGSVTTSTTATPVMRATWEIVSGSITTNICTWFRSLDIRLINCPVCAVS